MADTDLQAQVAIIGAGPAGMLLSHLLAADGVESIVLETRSEEYVASRIRAGILEQSTVDLLRRCRAGRAAGARGRPAPRHLPAVAQRAPPPRLRRPDRPLGLGLRADRGAEGPDRRADRGRPGDPLRGRRHRTARPRHRPPLGDIHRRRRARAASQSRRRGRLRRVVRAQSRTRAAARPPARGRGSTRTPGSASSPTSPRRPTS